MSEATSPLVTPDILRAEMAEFRADIRAEFAELRADLHRALWVQGAGIVAAVGAAAAATLP